MATPIVAIVLAGGLGTRLSAAVPELPKSMAPVRGIPFLSYVLAALRNQGVAHVWLAVGHRSDAIEHYFMDGRHLQQDIRYAREGNNLRGTGGALRNALDSIPRTGDPLILAMNGDTYLDLRIDQLTRSHENAGATVTLVLANVPDRSRYGGVTLNPESAVTAFLEKGETGPGWVSAGAYLARATEWDALLPTEPRYDLERTVLPKLVGRGLYGYKSDGVFIDIGVPADYARAATLLPEIVT